MKRLLRLTWLRLCNLIKISRPVENSLRDKAMAVAGRVSVVKDGTFKKVSCPVCLDLISAPLDSDIQMILAVHLSLWHPDDVKLLWQIMQKKRESDLHVPSFVLGVGLAAGFGALLAFAAKNKVRAVVGKRGKQS